MRTLEVIYREYIACLNRRALEDLHLYVHEDVRHNDNPIQLAGYIKMLENDYASIPDLFFNIDLIVSDRETVASRLLFDCTPRASFLGLAVNGRKLRFAEHVFYKFRDDKIVTVWSVIDKKAIESQL